MIKNGMAANNHNTLSTGTIVKGDVFAEEDLRVDAQIEGTIECKGKVIVGNRGVVTGCIRCKSAELMGIVTGDLFIEDCLTLRSSVNYSGEITAGALEIEPGAIFNGTCKIVTAASSAVTPNQPKEKEEE